MIKASKSKALCAVILSFLVFCSMMPVTGFAAGEEVVVPNDDNSKMILNIKSGEGTIAKDVNFYKEKHDGSVGERIVVERIYRITADPGYIVKKVDVDGKTEYMADGSSKKYYDFEDKVTGRLTHENILDISYPDHTFDVWFVKVTVPQSGWSGTPDDPDDEVEPDAPDEGVRIHTLASEADAITADRWIKDYTELGTETVKKVKVDKDFQFWTGHEFVNMFDAFGIPKDSNDEYVTYIKTWGIKRVTTKVIKHGIKYVADDTKPFGYENKVDGKDGSQQVLEYYALGDISPDVDESGVHRLIPPKHPRSTVPVGPLISAVDTVITKGTKPETKTFERKGKKYEVTTTYTLNEKTGEITPNFTEKEIAPKEYTVTIHAVDAVTGEKIKDIVKTYKEGTGLWEIENDLSGKEILDGYTRLIDHNYLPGDLIENLELTNKFYKNHTLTLKFINSSGQEIYPSKTYTSIGDCGIFIVPEDSRDGSDFRYKKGDAYYTTSNRHVSILDKEKDLHNGKFVEGSVLRWNNTDNTITLLVVETKDEGTQTDLTGKDIEEMQNKLKELEGKVTELNGKITTLEKDNKDLLDKNTALNTELEKVKKEKADLEAKIKELNDEITNLVGNIADKKDELADLTNQVEILNNNIKKLEGKIKELNTENQTLKDKIVELEKKIKELEAKSNQCSADDAAKAAELEKVKKELDDTKAELEKTKKDLADSKLSDAEKAKKIDELNKKITDLEKKIGDLTTENQGLKDKIADLEKKLADAEKKANDYKTSDEAKADELDKVKKELADTKVELEQAKKDIEAGKLSDAEKDKKISELNTKIADLEKKVNDLTAENQSLKDKVAALENKIKKLEEKANSCAVEDGKKAEELEKVKKELADTKAELEKTKKALDDSKLSDAEKAKKIEELNKKISDLEKKISDLTAENKSLKDKIAVLEKKLKDVEDKANKFETSDAEKAKEIDKLKKELADTKAELEKAKKDIEAGKLSDTEKDKKIEELNQKIADLEKKVNDLTSENAGLKDENQKLKDKVTTLEKKVKELEEKANTCTVEDGKKAEELEKVKKELEDTKKELEQVKKDLEDSKKSDAEKSKTIDELNKKISELEKKVNELVSSDKTNGNTADAVVGSNNNNQSGSNNGQSGPNGNNSNGPKQTGVMRSGGTTPKTGDSTNWYLLLSGLVCSLAGLLLIRRKKKILNNQ